jgi:sugar phosphate isomerase/epimerase
MPGQGVLPLVEFMHTLLAQGYAGVLTLEVSPMALGAWRPSRAGQRLASLVQSMRRLEAELDEQKLGPWIQIPG